MLGWFLFIGVLMLDLGFFLGYVFESKVKAEEKKREESFTKTNTLSEEEKKELEKHERKQKQILADINFLNTFTGEKEEEV